MGVSLFNKEDQTMHDKHIYVYHLVKFDNEIQRPMGKKIEVCDFVTLARKLAVLHWLSIDEGIDTTGWMSMRDYQWAAPEIDYAFGKLHHDKIKKALEALMSLSLFNGTLIPEETLTVEGWLRRLSVRTGKYKVTWYDEATFYPMPLGVLVSGHDGAYNKIAHDYKAPILGFPSVEAWLAMEFGSIWGIFDVHRTDPHTLAFTTVNTPLKETPMAYFLKHCWEVLGAQPVSHHYGDEEGVFAGTSDFAFDPISKNVKWLNSYVYYRDDAASKQDVDVLFQEVKAYANRDRTVVALV